MQSGGSGRLITGTVTCSSPRVFMRSASDTMIDDEMSSDQCVAWSGLKGRAARGAGPAGGSASGSAEGELTDVIEPGLLPFLLRGLAERRLEEFELPPNLHRVRLELDGPRLVLYGIREISLGEVAT